MRHFGNGFSLDKKVTCAAYIPHVHSPKALSYKVFDHFVHKTKLHEVEFSTSAIVRVLKVLDFGALKILDSGLRMLSLY